MVLFKVGVKNLLNLRITVAKVELCGKVALVEVPSPDKAEASLPSGGLIGVRFYRRLGSVEVWPSYNRQNKEDAPDAST